MAVLPIVTWPDDRLTTLCDPVGVVADQATLIGDMFDTMYDAPGRGLAAPQVGVLRRVFVMDCTWDDTPGTPMAFVNPQIIDRSPEIATSDEGCLSIPGIKVAVARPDWVHLTWTAPDGTPCDQRFEGFEATCVQHELDHLDGLVTFDRLDMAARAAAEIEYRALLT